MGAHPPEPPATVLRWHQNANDVTTLVKLRRGRAFALCVIKLDAPEDAKNASQREEESCHMGVTLTNKSRAIVTLELNTGSWIHLAPGETSRGLEEYEVRDNRYVRKLADRRLVTMTHINTDESAKQLQKSAKPDRSKKPY